MADNDEYSRGQDRVDTPGRKMWSITAHDSNALDPLPKALRFDSAGDVVARAVESTADVTFTVQAGEIVPVRFQYVRATGTTVAAGDIHGIA